MPDGAPIRVLVVDDEPLARMRLEDLLKHENGAVLVGTAENGRAAIDAIRALQPDLVFLDVQMPGLTGFDVVREVGVEAMPATIFVTAFNQFALQAFEVAAVDYLVKPFDDERFEQSFGRVRKLIALKGLGRLREDMLRLLQHEGAAVPSEAARAAPTFLERIAVEMRGKVRVVPVEQVDYITASGPYAELHVGGKTMLIRESLQSLDEKLDPGKFFRVHRSAIVRLALVEALHKGGGGDYEVQLKGGTMLRVSRSRREALERWLGVSD